MSGMSRPDRESNPRWIGFQVEIPGWVVSLSPVGCDEGKGAGAALIADAKQGKGSRQSTFSAGGGQEYYGQPGEGTCQSRPTTTQFESDAVEVMQGASVEPSTETR